MFISKLELKNFKRFTDLTIDMSEAKRPPKLVLLIGANGSGKSCVFDSFELVSRFSKDEKYDRLSLNSAEAKYYAKNDQTVSVEASFTDGASVSQGIGVTPQVIETGVFYGRSALRQIPRLTRLRSGTGVSLRADEDRPRYYIDFDQRFENDIDGIISKLLKDVFSEKDWDTRDLRDRYLKPINEALYRIFGQDRATSLALRTLIPPGENAVADIRFTKGKSDIHYDLLSSGEKEVVNILFNLFFRRELYQNTIYFIDELDVHLNTALQYNLIKEITENWLPSNCQLWTASHSLGFIQYAKESAHAAILDFDQFDFDQPQTITPQPKEVLEIYEVAVPKDIMLKVFDGKRIILCENKNDEYFNLLDLEKTIFVGVQDKRQVYLNIKNNPAYFGLMDRDYLTDSEIQKIYQQFPHLRILGYYAFENYLYHPKNLAELFPAFDVAAYQTDIVRQKNEQRDYILTGLELARRGYSILNDENIARDNDGVETILTALRSDELEVFYPYFDMKTRFNRHLLGPLKLTTSRLVKAAWFRNAIESVLL